MTQSDRAVLSAVAIVLISTAVGMFLYAHRADLWCAVANWPVSGLTEARGPAEREIDGTWRHTVGSGYDCEMMP